MKIIISTLMLIVSLISIAYFTLRVEFMPCSSIVEVTKMDISEKSCKTFIGKWGGSIHCPVTTSDGDQIYSGRIYKEGDKICKVESLFSITAKELPFNIKKNVDKGLIDAPTVKFFKNN